MHKTQLFVSGIPGCGKSTFGRWLAQEKQFTYVDMEHDDLDKYGFRSSWNTFADGTDGASFVSAIPSAFARYVRSWAESPSREPRKKDAFDWSLLGRKKSSLCVPSHSFVWLAKLVLSKLL
jgi:Shikimate kinase